MNLSSEELELLPSDEDVAFYREHGYYKSKKIFTDKEIAAAIEGSERYYRGERDAPLPHEVRGWQPEHGNVLRKNDFASLQNRELAVMVRKPLLGAIAARLCGSHVRLWHDQLLYKPVSNLEKAANVGWHTDRQYWKTCTSEDMLTAWIPFHDCDEKMGTIMMIDQSLHWPDDTEELDFFSNDLAGLEKFFKTEGKPIVRVPMNLLKGEVSFHSCLTIHGSGPNLSMQSRRSIAVHMQDKANRYREFRLKDGSLARHGLDSLCRQVDGHPDYNDPRMCPSL
jgi:ectoine hydroxylase-related dioxygenase (phytanoyl-CoA dioxygenase family)